MVFSFGVEELELVDGTLVCPPADGMTVFIGPNNSGKSVLLQEIAGHISVHPGTINPLRWINHAKLRAEGTADDLFDYLHKVGITPRPDPHGNAGQRYPLPGHGDAQGPEQGMLASQLAIEWERGTYGSISSLLVSPQRTGARLQDHTTVPLWNRNFPPAHPSQYLHSNPKALADFSRLVENAFSKPISINRYDWERVRLTIGHPDLPAGTDPASIEHWDAYQRLPGIGEQGDGFRSFVNILITTLVRPTPVIVIDEPEAFLHPPQARLLGRYLAQQVPSPCQVFVATHSADFLAGVLEASTSKDLALVRLARTDNTPTAKTLDPAEAASILKTPLLRYANIISGLFHDGVVLCESENDCQFYAATVDVINDGELHDNLVFLPTNGKDRLADTARRLRHCGIPTAVIADLDLLNESSKIRKAVQDLGGTWDVIRDDVQTLQKRMTDERIVPNAQSVKEEVLRILGDPTQAQTLTEDQCEKIGALLKSSNSWRSLKRSGLRFLNGAPLNATKRVIEYCANLGLFLLPVGELESWIPEIEAASKRTWFTKAFEEGHYQRPSLDLRTFCQQITTYLATSTEATEEPQDPAQP